MENTPKITGGIYLVLNPAIDEAILLAKLKSALLGGIQVVQIWNNWQPAADKPALIEKIAAICKPYAVPLLINADWTLLRDVPALDGIHFDNIPASLSLIQNTVSRPFLTGITCSENLQTVAWAQDNHLDYVSFCSMFPSSSAGICNIVMPATVKRARLLTGMPIFVAGGITPQNIPGLKKLTPFDGVAVISGILSAEDPEQKVKEFKNALSINPTQHATENN
ncbi:thiamine phosphate synthase [Mucilaginibacter sp. SMC90]|uniref:thiamine phosphate synthase n=1 Tax=Mucilaginibacter sp. SMC90 TaxID=2929803 RepID=UPI001FB4831E|nr:thiamine phosphate synthase [Mucilaginibacter sp. SMC90]UOE49107.1 thiamine phosphate synthase [Mucilaginibacter sp. SMC90]